MLLGTNFYWMIVNTTSASRGPEHFQAGLMLVPSPSGRLLSPLPITQICRRSGGRSCRLGWKWYSRKWRVKQWIRWNLLVRGKSSSWSMTTSRCSHRVSKNKPETSIHTSHSIENHHKFQEKNNVITSSNPTVFGPSLHRTAEETESPVTSYFLAC